MPATCLKNKLVSMKSFSCDAIEQRSNQTYSVKRFQGKVLIKHNFCNNFCLWHEQKTILRTPFGKQKQFAN